MNEIKIQKDKWVKIKEKNQCLTAKGTTDNITVVSE